MDESILGLFACICLAVLVCLFVGGLLFGPVYLISSKSCAAKAERLGLEHDFGVFHGCFVKVLHSIHAVLKSHFMICTERDMAKQRKKIVVEKVDPKLEQEWIKAGIGTKIVPCESTVTDLNAEMDLEYGWAKGSIPAILQCILRELVRARLERG